MHALTSSQLQKPHASAGYVVMRSALLSVAKLLTLGLMNFPLLHAAPTIFTPFAVKSQNVSMSPRTPTLWIYLAVAMSLVLLGGAFAGLTIALMGQDEIYLQVIEKSGEEREKKHAAKVLKLLKRGKHWVLVTLLLGNVITNETLPIVLDRSLGGGWPAVLGSTVLIVIFGEVIPQSICVRYGLPIGAWMSPLVLVLMYILAPAAWPTAKLLDRLLGEDHGTTYKKAGLKTLVTLHKTLGAAGEQLNSDEVTIISAVLDLKAKPIGSIMTPMEDVFTMSADTVLDENTMNIILGAGYSRIPIHAPDNPQNFVGMLLVKILITYDPEDCKRVRDFALATLPETRSETSCLDIVNFFQEGKSHMVLVSEFPGDDSGALGVVTLEDVIEELIGEEIIDESDVFIDVHRAIRRMAPAPKYRVPKGEIVAPPETPIVINEENLIDLDDEQKPPSQALRRLATFDGHTGKANGPHPEPGNSLMTGSQLRRTSSVAGTSEREGGPKRSNTMEMREHLKHLGPSNLASRPRQTRYNTVKIKPGGGSLADNSSKSQETTEMPENLSMSTAPQGGVGAGLLNSAGKDAKDGVLAVQAGYGSSPKGSKRGDHKDSKNESSERQEFNNKAESPPSAHTSRSASQSTLGSLQKQNSGPSNFKKTNSVARSGSITENIVDTGGIKKTVLETTSSSSDDIEDGQAAATASNVNGAQSSGSGLAEEAKENEAGGRKKRRRKRKGGK
ncbi:hypothetical protein MMC29_006264, partial [Sticta canariensis]|nr:hypothetical protein [Sticta canariensis]